MILKNNFDTCSIINHRDDPLYRVLSCTNLMNENDKHFLYNSKVAMCENHYCAITYDITNFKHNTITCSGAIFIQSSGFYNPLNVNSPRLDDLKEFPTNNFNIFRENYKLYYIKDSRTSFVHNIANVNCTNDFQTCLSFVNGQSFCIGNVDDIRMIGLVPSFVFGVIISFMITTISYLLLKEEIHYMRNFVTIVIYLVPLFAIGLILNAYFSFSLTAYVFGNIIITTLVPLLLGYLESYFEIYINDPT